MRGTLVVIFVALVVAGCSRESEAPAPTLAPQAAASAAAEVVPAKAAPARQERPLPAFRGSTLKGEPLDVSSLIGRRLLLVFFNPRAPEAKVATAAATAIAGERGQHNFEILGVAMGANSDAARAFVDEQKLDLTVLNDTQGTFATRLGMRTGAALVVVDAEGYIVAGAASLPSDGEEPERAVENQLRTWLRLPQQAAGAVPALGGQPLAPHFTAERLGGGERFDLSSTRGRPLVLIFFLHTCPHCHHALEALKSSLAQLPEATRPLLVGVSIANRTGEVRESLEKLDLDFFPVVFDTDGSIRRAFGAESNVPVVYLIDAEGRITARVSGWRDDRDPPLLRMRLARLAGQTAPMLLNTTGYSGDEFCSVCHDSENQTHQLTSHAGAFDTLVRHGAERDPECVGCHVVGLGEPGGYDLADPTPHLEDVGCETCHGRGGPHLSPTHLTNGDYEAVCVSCHDTKHSLGFSYAEFLPKVSHAANLQLLSLPIEEKRKLLAGRRKPRENLLPSSAAYVGSTACQSCHPQEHDTWSKQPHARALASLPGDQVGNADCQGCHTTAYGLPGGFPAAAEPGDHPALVGVGCESCHGPGGDHVKPDSAKIGNIVSLGDKCDSCVILQICGGCHDDANDPGFEFEVQDKIDLQRHGTIEPGTGKPKDVQAGAALPNSAWKAALARAFALVDAGAAETTTWTGR